MGGFYEHLIRITKRVKHSKNVLRVGNITLTKENLPRGKWKIGVIHELVKGRDEVKERKGDSVTKDLFT